MLRRSLFVRAIVMFALCIEAGVLNMAAVNVAEAGDFYSVGNAPAILYNAPSEQADKQYILGPGYPVEVVVSLENWAKVRDADGQLSWIQKSALGDHRMLMVKAPLANLRASPDDRAPLVLQLAQGVLVELVDLADAGWAHVAYQNGQSGYLRLDQVWGA